jgi:alpha-tubulin suppressor-like RCC1 family protein
MILLAGATSVYSQGAIGLNDYSGSFGLIQVFQAQPLANSTNKVTVNGFSGYEEIGQPANSYLSHPGATVYATTPSTIGTNSGTNYSVGLLALDGGGATNYSQLSFIANSVVTNWLPRLANATNNPSVNNNYGVWNTAVNASIPGNSSNASIAIAVWQNNGAAGAAATLDQAQADGYAWGVSGIVSAAVSLPPGFPTGLPNTLTSFSMATGAQRVVNGALWDMGFDPNGELGDGNGTGFSTNRPELIVPANVTTIAAFRDHCLFLKSDSTLWAMGDNVNGDLGNNSTTQTNRPQMITSNVTAIAAGITHSLFVKSDGSLWAMGDDSYGQLGDGSNTISVLNPEMIISNGVMAVAAGNYFSLYLTTNGTLYGMGQHDYGVLGDGMTNTGFFTNQPEFITNGVSAIACGARHSLFIKTNGSLWAMGYDNFGQLGDGSNNSAGVGFPEMVVSSNVAQISAGQFHTLFIKTDGSLWGMGNNGQGELGLGAVSNQLTPTIIVSNNVAGVAGAYNHTLFFKNDGSLWAMGENNYGELGNGQNTQTNTPVQIVSSGAQAVTGSQYSSFFIGAPPSAQIAVSQGTNSITNLQGSAVSFGSVAQNQTGPIVTFTISDTGGQTLDVTNISVPAGYSLVTNAPATIGIGSNGTFSVQLDTAAGGTFAGNITVTNNDPNNNPFVFPVTGTVNARIIALSGNMTFGVVPVNTMSNSTLTISNLGNTSLSVTNIAFPTGFSGVWSNMTIGPSNAQAITVSFSPTAVSNYTGNITVSSDATSGTGTIAASGFGATSNLFLTVITNGAGTVAPVLTAKALVAGHKYTLTATAKPGNVFSNWTGSVVTNKNPLTFVMAPGTVLEANFVTNPFLPTKGSYNGLFSATNGQITEQTVGMLKGLTVNTRGGYSGTLLIAGAGHGFSGTFNLAGQATNKIVRSTALGGNLILVLTLSTPSNAAPVVTGTITASNWVSTNLTADLATNATFSSAFTMTVPPDTNNPASNSIPVGDGYAVITNHTGSIKITGALADGTAFTQSVSASQTGDVPVYASLYGNKGLLLGWLSLDPTNAGSLQWVHPTAKTGLFTNAFVSTNPIALSTWTNPPAASSLPTNLLILDGLHGVITQTNAYVIAISNNYKIGLVSGPTALSGTLNPKTGQLSLILGTGEARQTATGVVLLDTTNGGGYLLNKTTAAAIKLR